MFDIESLDEYQAIMARLTPERRGEFARWAADLARQFETAAGLMLSIHPGASKASQD